MELELNILVRLMAALVFSGILGWERETLGKPAGLRTHMLVGGGSSMFVGIGEFLVIEFQHFGELLRFDPTRIIEAVVAAVGFLGAGTIFFARSEHKIQGLTTAASLWTTAGAGMAAGLGRCVPAAGATALIFLVLRGLMWFENKSLSKPAKDS